MGDFDLAAMARAAGVKVNKLLAAIEATKGLEDDLYAILYPMVNAYRQSLGYFQDQWATASQTQALVESMLVTGFSTGRALAVRAEPDLGDWSRRVEKWHRQRWVGVVKGATRLDITPILEQGDVRELVEAQTKINVGLIKGLSEDIEKRIGAVVWKAYADGTTAKPLGKALREEFSFAPKRARLIARDQLGKYSGALDKARQTQAGIDEYEWSTVGDDHVRPKHRENNRKRFTWAKRPPNGTGHPGEDVQCRCKAKAVLFTAEEEAELAAASAS